jgi:hypothetical protein
MMNTKKVADRRKLRFEALDEAIRDAKSLAEAQRLGELRATGNWTLGQALGHLAFWANCAFDGYPDMPRPPWFVRAFMPFMRNSFLNKGMPAGVHLGKVPGGTFGIDEMPTDDGLAKMRIAFDRLSQQPPTIPSLVFGQMTHEDCIKLNLRHAELHLSFFHPR